MPLPLPAWFVLPENPLAPNISLGEPSWHSSPSLGQRCPHWGQQSPGRVPACCVVTLGYPGLSGHTWQEDAARMMTQRTPQWGDDASSPCGLEVAQNAAKRLAPVLGAWGGYTNFLWKAELLTLHSELREPRGPGGPPGSSRWAVGSPAVRSWLAPTGPCLWP